MPIQLTENKKGNFFELAVSGRLTDEDYQHFTGEFERVAGQRGGIRMLVWMSDFHGWDAKGAWDDLKFGLKYHHNVERLAMVGEKKWQQWMTAFCQPFTTGVVRYFDASEAAKARAWVEEAPAAPETN